MFYHASLITRRGDVRPSDHRITIEVGDLDVDLQNAPGTLTTTEKKAFMASAELCQIGADYYHEVADAVPDSTEIVDLSKGEVRSDTGEMYRSWKKLYGTIDSPMTKCVYGRLARQKDPIVLDGMSVTCRSQYAVIAVSSLENDKSIAETNSMLLTAVGRAENTDQKMSVAPEDLQTDVNLPPYMKMDDFGHAPIVCEAIDADIELKVANDRFLVWSVNAEGVYAGTIPVTYEEREDGLYAHFTIGKKAPSIYYILETE